MHQRFTLILLLLSFSAFAQTPPFPQKGLKLKWEVKENGFMGEAKTLSVFTLTNTTKKTFPASGWTIYYNFIRFTTPLRTETAPAVVPGHVNGHLYTLKPTANFKGLAPGESIRINVESGAWVTNHTDAPDGPYIVWYEAPAKGYTIADYTVVPSTEDKQLRRQASDTKVRTTPEDIYKRNSLIKDIPEDQLPRVFPTPHSIRNTEGVFTLDAQDVIAYEPEFRQEAEFLAALIREALGKPVKTVAGENGTIVLASLRTKEKSVPGEHTLEVSADKVALHGNGAAGIFYAIQSFRQLLGAAENGTVRIPGIEVKDKPRFGYRSFMIDVSRNFQPKSEILRILDVLALYKLNVLHLHMSDDEGWRVEIPGLPELTEVGGRRGHTVDELDMLQPSYGSGPDANNTTGSGWYTKADYIEILRYAKARHIKVIPEVEMPGHARAAIKAMDARYAKFMKAGNAQAANEYRLSDPDDKSQYRSVQEWKDNVINVALPSTYKFIEKVTDELVAMHKEAGAPLDIIHMGGDETPGGVWERSPACRRLLDTSASLEVVDDLWPYFYDKVARIVNQRGLQLYGWEEAGMRRTKRDGRGVMIVNPDFGARNFMVDVWNNVMGGGMEDLSYRLANGGYKVVLSGVANYYFDMAYLRDYNEPGFYWGGYVDIDKPFYFIPLDLYKNAKEDDAGNALPASTFVGKDRLTEYGAGNIVGIQSALWGETLKSTAALEYLMLPKLLGMAERAWAKDPEWTKDEAKYNEAWSIFANVAGKKELPRLAKLNGGYNYRIPTAGVSAADGKVSANVQLPGLVIRYTVDGKEPDAKSPVYSAPVAQKGTIRFRVFDQQGRGGRTVTVQY